MAQKRRKSPAPQTQRSWTLGRMLLIIGYGIVFAVLGGIFFMRQELQRVGIFGDKPAVKAPASLPVRATPIPAETRRTTPTTPPPPVAGAPQRPAVIPPQQLPAETRRSTPPAPPQVTADGQRPASAPSSQSRSAARPSSEILVEEKKALDDILRSKR